MVFREFVSTRLTKRLYNNVISRFARYIEHARLKVERARVAENFARSRQKRLRSVVLKMWREMVWELLRIQKAAKAAHDAARIKQLWRLLEAYASGQERLIEASQLPTADTHRRRTLLSRHFASFRWRGSWRETKRRVLQSLESRHAAQLQVALLVQKYLLTSTTVQILTQLRGSATACVCCCDERVVVSEQGGTNIVCVCVCESERGLGTTASSSVCVCV